MSNELYRDRSPIDQKWVQDYCDEFIRVGNMLPEGAFKSAVFKRVEIVMDLMDAWQKRKWPMDKRRW